MTYLYDEKQAMRLKKLSFATLFTLLLFSITVLRYMTIWQGLILIFLAVILIIIGHTIYTHPISDIMKRHNDSVVIDDAITFHVNDKEYTFHSIDKIHIAPRYFKITAEGKSYKFYRVYEKNNELAKEIEHWVLQKD